MRHGLAIASGAGQGNLQVDQAQAGVRSMCCIGHGSCLTALDHGVVPGQAKAWPWPMALDLGVPAFPDPWVLAIVTELVD